MSKLLYPKKAPLQESWALENRRSYNLNLEAYRICSLVEGLFNKVDFIKFFMLLDSVKVCFYKDMTEITISVLEPLEYRFLQGSDIAESNLWSYYLNIIIREMVSRVTYGKVKIKLIVNPVNQLSPAVVVRYLKIILGKGMGIGDIKFRLKGLLSNRCEALKSLGYSGGYKVKIKGRYTRKDRAGVFILSEGAVSTSTVSNSVIYASDIIILRYGVCSISVWFSEF